MRGPRSRRPSTPAAKSAEGASTFRRANIHRDSFICAPACGSTSRPAQPSTPRWIRASTTTPKKAALIYGEDLHDIALEGAGTLDGQASYEWHLNTITDHYILPNQRQMEAAGKPLMRSFPAGFGKETVYPRMVLLLRCVDVRIAGLKFLRSRSWTINPYACKRLVIDGVYIYSAQKEAVWADGIDPDGCQDVRIANCTIETGDDAIVLLLHADLGSGTADRKHHRHQQPAVVVLERHQVLRRQQPGGPPRDHQQHRHHQLQSRPGLHGVRRRHCGRRGH